jgi:DNA-binding NtrC family response regulator
VLAGKAGRYRRLVPERQGEQPRWWDIDFFPLAAADGFRGLLGKIIPGPAAKSPLGQTVPAAVEDLRLRAREQVEQCYIGSRLPGLRRLQEQLRVAGQSDVPVILVGAAGTGKKTLAHLIHLRGAARDRPFAALDCRRLPAFAVGAVLWGETGAMGRTMPGTVYLNEPSFLPHEVQERLIIWLSEGEKQPRPRLLAGFRIDPAEAVRQRMVLDELRHHLDTLRIDVPTLGERRDDLPHLVDQYLLRQSTEDGKAVQGLTPDAWEVLLAYRWPGNLRELFSVLRQARGHAAGELIDAADLPATVRQAVQLDQMPAVKTDTPLAIRPLMDRVEHRLVELALRRTQGHRRRTAKLLGVTIPWLYKRLNELGLVTPQEKDDEAEGETGEEP